MRNLDVEDIERIADNRIYQVKSVDWNQKGKIDFVTAARINAVHRRAGKERKYNVWNHKPRKTDRYNNNIRLL